MRTIVFAFVCISIRTRNRLEGKYGVADVEDVLAATEYVSLTSVFDRRRVALRTTAGG